MSERDLIHAHPPAPQSPDGREVRVILPVASLRVDTSDVALGSQVLRVEAAASGIRAELNAAVPELATWWTTPCLWLGDTAEGHPGEIGVTPDTYRHMISQCVDSLLGWANQVIIVTTDTLADTVSDAVSPLVTGGSPVVWLRVDAGPDAAYDAADALRFGQVGPDGQVTPAAAP